MLPPKAQTRTLWTTGLLTANHNFGVYYFMNAILVSVKIKEDLMQKCCLSIMCTWGTYQF